MNLSAVGELTTSECGRTVVPSQNGAFIKALDFIWEISVKTALSIVLIWLLEESLPKSTERGMRPLIERVLSRRDTEGVASSPQSPVKLLLALRLARAA